jgi:hypothetical protein
LVRNQKKEKKMKKILSALLIGLFAMTASAIPAWETKVANIDNLSWLVYNYKASFTRIDSKGATVKWKEGGKTAKGSFETFGTAKDTLNGYIILPSCYGCGGLWGYDANQVSGSGTYADAGWLESELPIKEVYPSAKGLVQGYGFGATAAEEEAWIYVMRKGDKIRNTKGKKAVYRIPIDIEGGLFSKKVGAFHEGTKVGTATDPGALTSAWVKMSYAFPVAYDEYAAPYKYKKLVQDHTYGFMGFSNAMTRGGDLAAKRFPVDLAFASTTYEIDNEVVNNVAWIIGTGFGTALTTITKGQEGWCSSTPDQSCLTINKISGSTVGSFLYYGICEVTPMWNPCRLEWVDSEGQVSGAVQNEAPITGTWSMSLNNKLSTAAGFAKAEENVIKAFGGSVVVYGVRKSAESDGEFADWSWDSSSSPIPQ